MAISLCCRCSIDSDPVAPGFRFLGRATVSLGSSPSKTVSVPCAPPARNAGQLRSTQRSQILNPIFETGLELSGNSIAEARSGKS